jgi:hypothetical protein
MSDIGLYRAKALLSPFCNQYETQDPSLGVVFAKTTLPDLTTLAEQPHKSTYLFTVCEVNHRVYPIEVDVWLPKFIAERNLIASLTRSDMQRRISEEPLKFTLLREAPQYSAYQ